MPKITIHWHNPTFQHPLQALLPFGNFREEQFRVQIPDFIRRQAAAHTCLRPGGKSTRQLGNNHKLT